MQAPFGSVNSWDSHHGHFFPSQWVPPLNGGVLQPSARRISVKMDTQCVDAAAGRGTAHTSVGRMGNGSIDLTETIESRQNARQIEIANKCTQYAGPENAQNVRKRSEAY
jgi:hypothetical protein